MALKLLLDTLDGLTEAQQAFYVKTDDGKFKLDVDGVEDTKGLRNALQSERDARKELEKKVKAFDGMDLEQLRALQDRIENDEDLKLIRAGDKDKLREKWTEKMRKEFEKQLKEAITKAEAEASRANKWSSKVLDNSIREAAAKAGIHAHAIEDALFRGRAMFSLDDDGNAVQVRDGSVVLGKDGKTPFTPAEWLDSMKESAPHWFPASGGGGGAPANQRQQSSNAKTIKRGDFDSLDANAKMKFATEGGVVVD